MEVSWQLLLPGVPITSTRGAIGWSSVTLVRTAGRIMLVDTGSYGDRALLLACLQEVEIVPDDVDDVFLTHFHFDHVLNFDLFKNAAFHLSEAEIRYVTEGGFQAVNDPYVPAVIYPLLAPQVRSFSTEVEIQPGLRAFSLPGHTPGMSGLLLEQAGVLIAGDGIKCAHDFSKGQPPPAFAGREAALRSYRRATDEARIIIPGHDNPFRVPIQEKVEYLDIFSLELTFAGDPGDDPLTIRLPKSSSRQ